MIVDASLIYDNIYNGKTLMLSENILECLKDIKIKNSEGIIELPKEHWLMVQNFIVTLTAIFNKIYIQNKILEQWAVAKVIPLHKKAQKTKFRTITLLQIYVQFNFFLKN